MRGKRRKTGTNIRGTRITPAHAGKTRIPSCRNRSRTDHPRACGENLCRQEGNRQIAGSPPRMRGKLEVLQGSLRRPRITPAHAGKTSNLSTAALMESDHPRACGENLCSLAPPKKRGGSPPRMRGKPEFLRMTTAMTRITPAHAGKTMAPSAADGSFSDHPRACGENNQSAVKELSENGSPPRMRGKLISTARNSKYLRITPAHAGKTKRDFYCVVGEADHPRACGENSKQREESVRRDGSPPRMRGKHGDAFPEARLLRITPAHAGKTFSSKSHSKRVSDHPRACGENKDWDYAPYRKDGSPPRMRGKRLYFTETPRR